MAAVKNITATQEYCRCVIRPIFKVLRTFWWIKPQTGSIMQITRTIRRAVATVIITAGLAYPACAAVCPKGIGGCPSPGRCFLFTDADVNRFCDYTSRTGSPAIGYNSLPRGCTGPGADCCPGNCRTIARPDSAPGHCCAISRISRGLGNTTAPAPVPDTTAAVLQQASVGGLSDTIHLSAPACGTGPLSYPHGHPLRPSRNRSFWETRPCKTRPALALQPSSAWASPWSSPVSLQGRSWRNHICPHLHGGRDPACRRTSGSGDDARNVTDHRGRCLAHPCRLCLPRTNHAPGTWRDRQCRHRRIPP